MLIVYDCQGNGLVRREQDTAIGSATIWVDLINPTREEDKQVEQALGISIPTREEMAEIEASSRIYHETGAHFLTATLVYQIDTPEPVPTTVTFILAGRRLVTVRYSQPKAFSIFLNKAQKGDTVCMTGEQVLIGLLEAIVDRAADLVERLQGDVDKLAQGIFTRKGGQQTRTRRLDITLRQIGQIGELGSRVRESLHSLSRVLTYLTHISQDNGWDKPIRARIKTEVRDVQSLVDHVTYLTGRITFLLDATLGMINIEQNQIIKLFSVAAVVLMPPTLVASIYGMNFKNMPELDWVFGYPLALGLMVLAAILPFLFFKRKGWL